MENIAQPHWVARIGILGNNEKDCATADFRVLEQEDMLTALIHVVMML